MFANSLSFAILGLQPTLEIQKDNGMAAMLDDKTRHRSQKQQNDFN